MRTAVLLLSALMLAGCNPVFRTQRLSAAPATAEETRTSASVTDLPDRQALLDAFRMIAFTSEYHGDTNEPMRIRKWTAPIRLAVHGSPTEKDKKAVASAMDGLNALDGFPGISVSEGDANADIWFVKLDGMDDVVPGYVEGNWGFFTVMYDLGDTVIKSTIAIATDVTDQAARTHLIHEELLQSVGLMQDEYTDPGSIFYGDWTTTPEPKSADWELLRILYMPELKPGMSEKDAMAVLQESYES